MKKSSIVYSFLVRALNLQILKIKRGSMPRIDRSFMLRSSVLLSQAWSVVHRAFLVLLPITVDYLDCWAIVISVTVIRRHDIALPSISATVFTTLRSRELTLLSSVLSTPDTRLGQLTITTPHRLLNGTFYWNRRYESSIYLRARQYHCSCFSSS
jgi:hypothetical protein